MAKFYGEIGYAIQVETKPGVWTKQITKRKYSGDLIQNVQQFQETDQLNDNLNIANEISIIADPFANENVQSMVYVEFMGAKWKIKKVKVTYPRLYLTIGGVYNGK